jgi:succinate dehydrogenase / fumarate reductase, cytochrome b subunit
MTPRYFSSSTGKKFLMAFTGAALFGFVVAHLLGNLQIFAGQETINAYAALLKGLGPAIWIARIGLLTMALVHVYVAIQLTRENRKARPAAYEIRTYKKASYASRTMAMSGLIVLGFIIYHLLHFTFIQVHPQYGHLVDGKGRHDVYSMMVLSFQQPAISLAYIVAMLLLGMHLSHGLSSMFQSVGLNTQALRPRLSLMGQLIAWTIFAGYIAIPAAVLAGMVQLPPGVTP